MKRTLLEIALLSLGLAACTDQRIDHVVLISIDTLRADHVGSYGRPGDVTPYIDALASEGTRFENVVSPIPLTLPAHTSMMTGKIPPTHGIHDNLSYRVGDAETTLAERLNQEGYATGAVVGSFVLDSEFNLSQGFDSYNDDFEEEHKIAFLSERKGDEVTRFAMEWLEAHRAEPFFLFVHYYDPHDDYEPPEPFASRFPDEPYAGEVAFTDHQVGRILEKLRELGLYEKSLIVVTGDHGEMLEEHGELTHGYFIYESALRVPLVLRAPGVEPRVVTERAGIVDVAPTIAGLLGLEFDSAVEGVDLSMTVRDGAPRVDGRREYFSESLTPTRYYGAASLFGLTTEHWKYIHTTRPELYDLQEDPTESQNVVSKNPRIAEGMRKRIEETLARHDATVAMADLDEDARRRLESLGYLSGGAGSIALELESDRADPKDWIEFYREHQRLEKLVQNEEYDEGQRLAMSLVERHPAFTAGYLQLARIATETGDLRAAVTHYETVLQSEPGNQSVHFNLANILVTLDRTEAAVTHYRKALEIDPAFQKAKERLGALLIASGATDEALAYLAEVVSTSPGSADARVQMGAALAARGSLDEAITQFRTALGVDPGSAIAHFHLASALARKEELDESIVHFRRALELAPGNAEVAHQLGLAVRQRGNLEEALQFLSRAVELDPKLALAHNDLGVTLKEMGRLDDAMRHYRRAVEIDPALAEAHNNMGSLLGSRGRVEEAVSQFRRAIEADPHHAEAHNNLGLALRMTGFRDQAIPHFEAALSARPNWPVPMNELAWILATHPSETIRDPKKALGLARRAAELTQARQPVVLDTLAAALAANGNFEKAVETVKRAAEIAAARAPALAAEMRTRQALYEARKPFVEARSMRASPGR